MAERGRASLKEFFEKNDRPTQAQFADLIDSVVNITDDFADKYVKVEVSSAEILALNTTPKVLVAAPGAGKALVVSRAYLSYTFVSTAYVGGYNLLVNFENAAGNYMLMAEGSLESAVSFVSDFYNNNYSISQKSNDAIVLKDSSANPTAGDGTLTVHLWYKILTL